MHVYFRSASGFKNSVPSEWRYIPPKYFIPNLSCNLQNSFTLGMDFSVNHQQLLEPLIANSQNSSLLSPIDAPSVVNGDCASVVSAEYDAFSFPDL